jgi:hypothetical protein
MVALDSESALNPLMLLRAIVRTRRQYVLIVLVFFVAMILLRSVWRMMLHWSQPTWLKVIGYAIVTYGGFVVAHILGRFYWRNRERLDWGI